MQRAPLRITSAGWDGPEGWSRRILRDFGGVAALLRSAMGDVYPAELAPNSLVTWSALHEAVEAVDCRLGRLTDTGLDDGIADAVVCFDSFQFAPDPGRCAGEIARVPRWGGRFVMTGWTCFHGNGDEPVDLEAVLGGGGLVVDSYTIRDDLLALERAVFEAAAAVDPGESRASAMLREEAREVLPGLGEFDGVMVTATKP